MSNSMRAKIQELRFGDQKIKRRPWSEQDDNKLTRMYQDGIGISEMCLKLHRTENAVTQRTKKLRLSPPKVSSKYGSPEQRKEQLEHAQRKGK